MSAYVLRISDWSSDVCSSDLGAVVVLDAGDHRVRAAGLVLVPGLVVDARCGRLGVAVAMCLAGEGFLGPRHRGGDARGFGACGLVPGALGLGDPKRVVEGHGVSLRVELGGRRSISKKK